MNNEQIKIVVPNVLIATGIMNAGGAETLIMEILRRKSNNVNYILLIHYTDLKVLGVYGKEIENIGIPVFYIHSVGSVGEKKYTEEFVEVIKQIGHVDVLHSHLNAVGGIISKAAKKANIPNRIVHCHANITYKGSWIYKTLCELKLQYMKIFVNRYATEKWACSPEAAKRLFGTVNDTVVIPNIIYVASYLPNGDKKKKAKEKFCLSGTFVVGAVGRIVRIKNYELIIRTIAQLKSEGFLCKFICFGRVVDEGYYLELIKLARELLVEDEVNFVGNSAEISLDIHCIDVFVMPSYSEGFGIAALEAQAAGIRTIVSKGVPQIVDMGLGAVKFLGVDNEKEWATEIMSDRQLNLKNMDIVEKFNEHGYNSESMILEIEERYLNMLNKKVSKGENDGMEK